VYQVLSKDMIELKIVPYLPETKRDFKPKAPLYEIVNAILYKINTGIKWEYLPVESLINDYKIVIDHYRKCCGQDVWRSCWIQLLKNNRSNIDLSSGDLGRSHTTALKGG